MGLLVSDGSEERIMELEPDQAVMVTGYHNGFSIDRDGYFMVVERAGFPLSTWIEKQGKLYARYQQADKQGRESSGGTKGKTFTVRTGY